MDDDMEGVLQIQWKDHVYYIETDPDGAWVTLASQAVNRIFDEWVKQQGGDDNG